MNKYARGLMTAWIGLFGTLAILAANPRSGAGDLLVKFKPGADSGPAAHPNGMTIHKDLRHIGWQWIQMPPGLSVDEGLRRYRSLPGIQYAEPAMPVKKLATPNDTKYGELWGMEKISAPKAWEISTGSKNVVVGIVDTGVDFSHPDIAPNAWVNPGETAGNGLDDDQDGYVDNVNGIDVVEGDGDPADDDGHGTHVAGTVGAAGNNGQGVTGVCWNVSLLGVRIGAADGFSTTPQIAAAYDFMIGLRKKGVNLRVVNNSWGNDFPSRAIHDAFLKASDQDILIVCAAGNDGLNNDLAPHYPSGFDLPTMISVAASDENDAPASFSNYGIESTHLAAPGVGILSTLKGGRFYATFQGTSMASPHVAGAAALIFSKRPDLTALQVKTLLLESVDRLPQWEGKVMSAGRLNVGRAMERAAAGGAIGSSFVRPQNATPPAVSSIAGPAFTRISRGRDGHSASSGSSLPAISADGRFVVFASDSTNLVAGAAGTHQQVFLHDRTTGTTIRISQNAAKEPGDADSLYPTISGDGRYIVFMSDAANLVPDDLNGDVTDVFLFDREAGTLSLISLASGLDPANGASSYPVISADGRWIAFESEADNLTGDDLNFNTDVFLYDRLGQTPLTRVSASPQGTRFDDESYFACISGDGRYVGFTSAGALLAGDRNNAEDVYLYDRVSASLERVSVTTSGASSNGGSSFSNISGDGRYVTFETSAANIIGASSSSIQIVVRDRTAKTTTLVSKTTSGTPADSDCYSPIMSPDGRYTVFISSSQRLESNNGSVFYQAYLHDRLTGRIGRVSYNSSGNPAGEDSTYSVLSRDGRFLAMDSRAFNLDPADGNADSDIFVADLGTVRPDLMVKSPQKTFYEGGGVIHPLVLQRAATKTSPGQSATFDVRLENAGVVRSAFRIRFNRMPDSWSTRLTTVGSGQDITGAAAGEGWLTPELDPGAGMDLQLSSTAPGNPASPVAETVIEVLLPNGEVRDRIHAVGTVSTSPPGAIAISRAADGTPADAFTRGAVISGDGSRVVFQSDSSILATGDDNFDTDLFSYEKSTGILTLISRAITQAQGNATSDSPSMSADGRLVVFSSRSTNYISNDRNNKGDIYLKNLDSRQVTRISVNSQGTEASRGSDNAQISADGQVVVFQSMAPDLAPNDFNRSWDVFLRDLRTSTTVCLSRAPSGRTGNAESVDPQVSGDGKWVAFTSYASDLTANDENDDEDVFLVNVATGAIELVSHRPDGKSASGGSTLQSISRDGRWVLFDSSAPDLLGAGQPEDATLFLYDRTTGKIEALEPVIPGYSGLPPFSRGVLSPDGRRVILNSATPGLVPQDTNTFNDVFLLDRDTGAFGCLSLVEGKRAADGPSFGGQFSADGRFITFRSESPALLGEGTATISQVFLYDAAHFQPALTLLPSAGRSISTPPAESTSDPLRVTLPASGTGPIFVPIRLENQGTIGDPILIQLVGPAGSEFRLRSTQSGPVLIDASQVPAWTTSALDVKGAVDYVLELPRSVVDSPATNKVIVSSQGDPGRRIVIELSFAADADSDGLPDSWEQAFFGNLTSSGGAADSDGDGLKDLAEFEAGTDPANPVSRFAIQNVEPGPDGTVVLRWNSVSGRFYDVERANGSPSGFTAVAQSVPATPPQNVFREKASGPGESVFFRIRLRFP